MVESFKNVMVQSGALWVLWLLIGISVLSVGVMIDRALVFVRLRDDVPALVQELNRLLGAGDLESAAKRLARSPSAGALVARAGLAQWDKGARSVKGALAAASGLQKARLEKRLSILGTVGNNAPFVGLLGTVIGVVGAFSELGRGAGSLPASATQLAPERVMSTISEALVATAVGLIVAIPAVAVFNYFQGLLATALDDADTLGHVLLTHLSAPDDEDAPDPVAARRPSAKAQQPQAAAANGVA